MWEVIVGLLSLGAVIFSIGMQASRSHETRARRTADRPTPPVAQDNSEPPSPALGPGQNQRDDKKRNNMASIGV
jgi:hypothetical protein